jgi:hypothetical protein
MEELLRKLTIQSPPQGLRERVLSAARAEMQQAAEKQDWLNRLWESRAFWYSSAAAVFVCLVAIFVASDGAPPREIAAVSMNPAAKALAQEIARTLGDGPALERRLTAQLAGTGATVGNHELSRSELLRSIQ